MNQPPLNPDALEAAARAMYAENPRPTGCFSPPFVAWHELRDGEREVIREGTYTAVSAYLAAALPEVTSVEELDQLPVGAVVYASNHIGPAEKFAVGWMGCGNNAAWSSALLARDGLPARVLYRPEVRP